tara:strand:+ start:1276 stop:1584 length:309 start_codon:yes stop_codon:yes gene_type:complete
MPFYLYKSDKKNKKFVMIMPEFSHSHHFGDSRYSDYTIHKDEERAKLYRARHKGDKINDVHSAGALSWFILWSAPSLSQGIKNYEKRFNVKVVNRTNQTYKK